MAAQNHKSLEKVEPEPEEKMERIGEGKAEEQKAAAPLNQENAQVATGMGALDTAASDLRRQMASLMQKKFQDKLVKPKGVR